MKLLSLLGLSLVPLLVVSQSPPDVNLHLQDEGSVSSGEATEVMDTSSGQNNLRGSAHALSTRLQEDAALRNESSSVLASYPQQQRRQLECCGGDSGGYGELKCPEGSFVTRFYGHYWHRVHKLGIVCSNGMNVGSHGTEGQHERGKNKQFRRILRVLRGSAVRRATHPVLGWQKSRKYWGEDVS